MIEVYTMYLGRLAAALMTPNTMFQLECSACGLDWRTCPTDNVLSKDHIHVPCTLLLAHVAHSMYIIPVHTHMHTYTHTCVHNTHNTHTQHTTHTHTHTHGPHTQRICTTIQCCDIGNTTSLTSSCGACCFHKAVLR